MNTAYLGGVKTNVQKLFFPQEDRKLKLVGNESVKSPGFLTLQPLLLLLLLIALWIFISYRQQQIDPAGSLIGEATWLMALLSLIIFLLVLALCMWLLQLFWLSMGLPPVTIMVSRFNTLELWQQLGFCFALLALLLLAATACLLAIC